MKAHKFDPNILRAYDIRGVYGENLNEVDALVLGRAFGTYVNNNGGTTVCVGRDGRVSSPALTQALIQGLLECGIDVTDIGIGPTPMLYFAHKQLGSDGAVMVTGSHNPAQHNGFKISLRGNSLFGQEIQELGLIAESGKFAKGQGIVKVNSVATKYTEHLINDFIRAYPNPTQLKIAWDPGNGASCAIVAELTKQLPGNHIIINGTVDGTFPAHPPDPCTEGNIEELRSIIINNNYDLGIALDGDGDRVVAVDSTGRIFLGDMLLAFLAEETLKEHPGATIVTDVKVSQALLEHVEALGGSINMSPTGHSLIKAKMKAIPSPLAGEMSGHIFFADRYYGYDDGLYAALRLIGGLTQRQESLAQWYQQLPVWQNTPELNIPCCDSNKFAKVETVRTTLTTQGIAFLSVDGVRVQNSEGGWLLRASNTQAKLVARFEARTREGLEQLYKELTSYLQQLGLTAEET